MGSAILKLIQKDMPVGDLNGSLGGWARAQDLNREGNQVFESDLLPTYAL